MILQSEDKNRTVVETLIYAVLILSAVVSIFRAAVQPVDVPTLTADKANIEYHA